MQRTDVAEMRQQFTRSDRFQSAFNLFLKANNISEMTAVEIARKMNRIPDLTDDGTYHIKSDHAAQLLRNRNRKYKR